MIIVITPPFSSLATFTICFQVCLLLVQSRTLVMIPFPIPSGHDYDLMCSARYVTNLLVTLPSPQSTVPLSVVPRVMAFLWTATNWRFSLCSSDSVIFLGGRVIQSLSVEDEVGMDKLSGPPSPVWSERTAETMAAVVCSSAWRASVGAFAAWTEMKPEAI